MVPSRGSVRGFLNISAFFGVITLCFTIHHSLSIASAQKSPETLSDADIQPPLCCGPVEDTECDVEQVEKATLLNFTQFLKSLRTRHTFACFVQTFLDHVRSGPRPTQTRTRSAHPHKLSRQPVRVNLGAHVHCPWVRCLTPRTQS